MTHEEIEKTIGQIRAAERVLAYAIRIYYAVFSVTAITTFMNWSQSISNFFGKDSLASTYIAWIIIASALLVTAVISFIIEQKRKKIINELKPHQGWIISQNVPFIVFLLSLATLWVFVLAPLVGFILSTIGLVCVEWYYRSSEKAFRAILETYKPSL